MRTTCGSHECAIALRASVAGVDCPDCGPTVQERIVDWYADHSRSDRQWTVLVSSMMLARTNWQTALPVTEELLIMWPDPAALAAARIDAIEDVVRPCGFGSTRATQLRDMSREYIARSPVRSRTEALALPGVGPFTADAYALFALDETWNAPAHGALIRARSRLAGSAGQRSG